MAAPPVRCFGTGRFALQGRVALVTGAARGLGFTIARGLAACGATVVLNGRDPDRLDAAAKRLMSDLATEPAGAGGAALPTMPPTPPTTPAHCAAFDVTDAAAMRTAVADLEQRLGRIDILVNNVGVRDRRPLAAFSADDVRGLLETDLVAAMMLMQAVLPGMRQRRYGRVISLTSIAGNLGRSGDIVYSMAKHGLTGLVRAVAGEYGGHGITSNGIAPGGFRTEHNAAAYANPAVRAIFEGRTPLARWGEPEEIAGAAIFLASDAASYVNGHVLVVDGGMTAVF